MKTSELSNTPDPERPIWKRWTVIGGTLLAAISFLEGQGAIPAGTGQELASVVQHAAALLAGLGIYRHIPTS